MHLLYIMPFDRLLAALVLIKYKAIFVAVLLSNYQKSCFICLSSALVSQSINICTCHVYRCLSKASIDIHDSGHDSSRFEQDGKIEVHLGLKSSINSCVSRCS